MEGLGINPTLLITQIINFLIIMGVLGFFLYKPLLKGLEDKKKKMAEEIAIREKLLKEEQKMEEKRKKVLADARDEASRLMKEAVDEAKQKTHEMLQSEREKLADEREKMVLEIKKERQELTTVAKHSAVEIAVLIVSKLMGEKLTTANQKRLLDEALADLGESKVN